MAPSCSFLSCPQADVGSSFGGCRDRDAPPPRRAGLLACAPRTLCSGKIPGHPPGQGVGQSITLSPLQHPTCPSPDPARWESPAGPEGLKQSQVQCQRQPRGMGLACLVLGELVPPPGHLNPGALASNRRFSVS